MPKPKTSKLNPEQLFNIVVEFSKSNDVNGLEEKTGSTKDAILKRIVPFMLQTGKSIKFPALTSKKKPFFTNKGLIISKNFLTDEQFEKVCEKHEVEGKTKYKPLIIYDVEIKPDLSIILTPQKV